MFENKKILILGMARSGYEAAKLLISYNNEIVLNDKGDVSEQNADQIKELEDLGVKLVFGLHPLELLEDGFEIMVKNPGIHSDHPMVKRAIELGIYVTNEVEVAYSFLPKDITLIGITGSNGKTTTTTLIYEMLKEERDNVYLVGNIGFPLCSFVNIARPKDILVMEVSVQQLSDTDNFSPDIVVFTNFSETHLDIYKTYDLYQKTKLKIFKNQKSENLAILNYEDLELLRLTKGINVSKEYFSTKEEVKGTYLKNNDIYNHQSLVFRDVSRMMLRGEHNYQNIMAAISVVKKFDISNEAIEKVLLSFKGVAHRIEFVRELNGRKFYNDSKSTNMMATITALKSFNDSTILILGGEDRDQKFIDLNPYIDNVKIIIGYGAVRERVVSYAMECDIETKSFETISEATIASYDMSEEGDTILLSPGSGSWDQYKKFEDRGDDFINNVNQLK